MLNSTKTFALFLTPVLLVMNLQFSQAEKLSKTAARIPVSDTIFLSTAGLKNKQLVCYKVKKKNVVAIFKNKNAKGVAVAALVSNKATKQIIKNAKTECAGKELAAACNDGKDNDLDGKRDFPADPGCSSTNDTAEEDPGQASPFEVFRKPFSGDFSVSGLFDHRYPLEFIHTDGLTISSYNEETTIGVDGHQGYDFSMPEGTPLLADYDGIIEFAGTEDPFFCPLLNQTVAGKSVFIRHEIGSEKFITVYAHLSSLQVQTGQTVKTGDQLGLSGNTGCSTGPHLHYDIQRLSNTNDGNASSIDPFGWNSTSADPWIDHAEGTDSFPLWEPGYAPSLARYSTLSPNPNPGNNAFVAITVVQWMGVLDNGTPNNEYIELTLDTRYATSNPYNLSGFKIKNDKGESYTFASGTLLNGSSTIKIFSGIGADTETVKYWNRSSEAWSNKGDCARLAFPNNNLMYYHFYGAGDCVFTTADGMVSGGGHDEIREIENRDLK